MWENQYMPPLVAAAPVIISGRAPARATRWPASPEITTSVPANGRKATPERIGL